MYSDEEIRALWDWVRQARADRPGNPNGGLFIPLEVVRREYPGKIFLAAEMVSRGMPVFLGHKSDVVKLALESEQAGILFYKSAWGPGFEFFRTLLEKGFAICAQDEEAGIIYDRFADFFDTRVSLRTAGLLDRFFCWGAEEYEHLQRHCHGDAQAIRLTGSPRTVTWGPAGRIFHGAEIERIREQHGSFVLFATNFASGNSYLGDDVVKLMEEHPTWKDKLEKTFPLDVARERRLMKLFAQAADDIGQKLGLNVVIRPHPAEDSDAWRRLVGGNPRIVVASDGPITPWLLAARCVVHNSCTTGLEAALADVPTIALGETGADFHAAGTGLRGISIPNRCSIQVEGKGPLLDAVTNIEREWDAHRAARESIISRKAHKPGTLEPVTAIGDALMELGGAPDPLANSGLGRDSFMYDLREFYRTSRFRRASPQAKMDQVKRPTMRQKAVRDDIARALDVIGSDARFTVARVAQNAFRLQRVV